MTIARRCAVDHRRRRERLDRKLEQLGRDAAGEEVPAPDFDVTLEEAEIGDDLLRLIFTACYLVLPTRAQVALTLRVLGGLRTDEIAHAFLMPEATVVQRIVRAKRTLAEARVPFEVPRGQELAVRPPRCWR
jgi:predicted RNA polymerase sigma factor